MGYFLEGAIYENKSLDISAQTSFGKTIQVSSDGNYLYAMDNKIVFQYDLSTPFQIDTGSYSSKSHDFSSEDSNAWTFYVKPSGEKIYMAGRSNDTVYQYTMTTPGDVSSVSYDSLTLDFSSEDGSIGHMVFSPDGLRLYIVGTDNNSVFQYSLSTPWDISSASYNNKSLDLSQSTGSDQDIQFDALGKELYVIGEFNTIFGTYQLSTPWDISSAKFLTNQPFDAQNEDFSSFAFSDAGRKMYIYDSSDTVYQYDTRSLYERDKRNVNQSLQVSWKKSFDPSITLFTIGVSLIGGNDLIAPSQQQDSQWNKYQYFDETDFVQSLEWEHGLNIPVGGISQGLAAGVLDNTTGRYLPDYMGGSGEYFTSILPRRPFIINAGFENNGVDYTEPQFVGLFSRAPEVDVRGADLRFNGADFVNFLQNKYVDNTVMYTGQRSDQLIETILQDLGYSTAQYDLDTGINTIPFAIFNKGERFSEIIHKITQAENAQFYQDESGILKFENRQHWDTAPYNEVQFDIFTSQVIEAKAPSDDHIINVVEVNADIRRKQPDQTIFKLPIYSSIEIPAGETVSEFFQFEDPVLSLTHPTSSGTTSYYKANTQSDGEGSDATGSLTVTNRGTFAEAVKYELTNSSGSTIYLTELVLSGRIAKKTETLYYRTSNDNSVTAFEEQPLVIENDYIHEVTWAQSLASLLLNDFAQPENLQEITILAIPSLKLGDLISWQGRNWRVYRKSTKLNPDVGFVQELTLLQRAVSNYFRIGISTIGGAEQIAP